MNPNVWNIKEVMNIPMGIRTTSKNASTSQTDSQFQFWPDNSQGASQDMSVSSRTSQQSSQEGSKQANCGVLSNYLSKPLLFGEGKDKFKAGGILDSFEEDKRRAKQKLESEFLAKECLQIKEMLISMQPLISGTEKNTAECKTVLEDLGNFALTLKGNLASLQSDVSQQFESLLSKVMSQTETLKEMDDRVHKTEDGMIELGSNMDSIKNNLVFLREEREREQKMLQEALGLLNTLVSKHLAKPNPEGVTDSAVQTAPELLQPIGAVQQKGKLGDRQLSSRRRQRNVVKAPLQDTSCLIRKTRSTSQVPRRRDKRPLVLSQPSKTKTVDENRRPLSNCHSSSPDSELRIGTKPSKSNGVKAQRREGRSSKGVGSFITPLSCWSEDSENSVSITGFQPILKKLSAEVNTEKPKGLWQLFGFDCDSELGLVEDE